MSRKGKFIENRSRLLFTRSLNEGGKSMGNNWSGENFPKLHNNEVTYSCQETPELSTCIRTSLWLMIIPQCSRYVYNVILASVGLLCILSMLV